MFFLQRNKNILNYYDFANVSSLCFYKRTRKGLFCKRNILIGHLKFNMSKNYTLLLFFSEKNVKKVNVMHMNNV